MAKRSEIGLVYLAGLVQGVALVTFPAASSIFTSPHPQSYGIAAFGVGPLRDVTGVPLSTIYAGASLVVGAMIVLAFLVIRPQTTKAAQVSA
jgi:hypothetical protein